MVESDLIPEDHRAKASSRYFAFKVDSISLVAGFVLSLLILPSIEFIGGDLLIVMIFVCGIGFHYFYHVIFEFLGSTVGKIIVNLKVVDRSKERISFKQSLIRNSERFIWLIPVVGQLKIYENFKNIEDGYRRPGDMWADTYVIKMENESYQETNMNDNRSTNYYRRY